ncbi:MAG: hypothetical protein K8T26_01550 [Lentisphaerae bacterium]|nr:hypothetical protein [Lentisphaerota bacterium]
MFEEVQRAIERLGKQMEVNITLPLDDDGYFDRKCPHGRCGATFKVLFEDWKAKVAKHAYCPICRHDEDVANWNTAQQEESIKRQGLAALQKTLDRALGEAVRQTRPVVYGGLARIALSYKPGATIVDIPIKAAEAMQSKATCEKCGCRYGSIGLSFFCPACGNDSTVSTSGHMLGEVRKKVQHLQEIRTQLTVTVGKDSAENLVRDIREGCLKDLVGLFQHFSDLLFATLPYASSHKLKRNTFQRLDEASTLWGQATGKDFDSIISAPDFQRLKFFFQRRHLLEHRNGVVDQEYLDKSGDRSFSVGQRLVISDGDVAGMCDLVTRLCSGMQASVKGSAVTP